MGRDCGCPGFACCPHEVYEAVKEINLKTRCDKHHVPEGFTRSLEAAGILLEESLLTGDQYRDILVKLVMQHFPN